MRVEIATLRKGADVRALLASDGWRLQQAPGDSLLAWHPDARDGSSVRQRLFRLGLLTAASLRIRLEPDADDGYSPGGGRFASVHRQSNL